MVQLQIALETLFKYFTQQNHSWRLAKEQCLRTADLKFYSFFKQRKFKKLEPK